MLVESVWDQKCRLLAGSSQTKNRVEGGFQAFIVVNESAVFFKGQRSRVHLFFQKNTQPPWVGIDFVEIKINPSNVLGPEDINAYSVSAKEPSCARYLLETTKFAAHDFLRILQFERSFQKLLCPSHFSMPQGNDFLDQTYVLVGVRQVGGADHFLLFSVEQLLSRMRRKQL